MKYGQLENEARQMGKALRYSKNKIGVFLFTLLILVVILGTVMYLIESPFNGGFSSIPISIYWAVVTLTTVGYGDIAPITTFGQTLAGFIMILGYSIIAVPTGIVTAEFSRVKRESELTSQVCPACLKEGHEEDALFCKFCGSEINPEEADTN